MSGERESFIQKFMEKAESIKDDIDRSKKYRAGIAALAQKAMTSNDIYYLEIAIRFTDNIIDGHDRSKAYVDIIRSMVTVANNLSNPELSRRALALSARTDEGHDRSHALEGVVSAVAEVGIKNDEPGAIESAKKLAETIEYDTYRSSSWRSIARTLHGAGNNSAALESTAKALDIIDSSDSIARPVYRASAYVDLSKLFLDIGQIDTAINCIEKAERSANSLVNEFERSSIYQSIVETRLIMGARTKDRTHFKWAVKSYGQITREYYLTSTRQKLNNMSINFNEQELDFHLTNPTVC